MRSGVSSAWLTNCGILDKSFASQEPKTQPGRKLQRETTLGPCCFSESQKPADHW